MKIKSIILIGGLILLALAGINSLDKKEPDQKLGGAIALTLFDSIKDTVFMTSGGGSNATTSYDYVNSSATTTKQFFSERGDMFDIDLQFAGSSTNSELIFTREYSPNGVDWYFERCKTNTSNVLVTFGAKPCVFQWSPASVATSTANITVEPTASKFSRLNFSARTDNGRLHTRVVVRERAD